MCCQDGDGAIWQKLYEPAGWSTEAEGSFPMHEQPAPEELPTTAAELIIKLVAIQDGKAVRSTAPPGPPRGNWLMA